MAPARPSRTLVEIVASVMILGFAVGIIGGDNALQDRTSLFVAPMAGSTTAPLAAVHESLVSQSAEASLARGAGPALGHSESCAVLMAGSAHCRLSAAPAVTNSPSWYNVTDDAGTIDPTYVAAIAWDPNLGTGELIYFGGCDILGPCPDNYTWAFGGNNWVNESLTIGIAPPPIAGQSMDWDPALEGIVMAGGGDLNGLPDVGTWLFTDGTWENITSTTGGLGASPSSVFGAMAWDPATQSIDYVSGCTNETCGSVWNAIWSLGPSGTWSGVEAFGFVYGESMAYDAADQEMVAYGGTSPSGAQLNATWTLADGTWTNRTASSVGCFFTCDLYPTGRSFSAMSWDGQTDSILLFGGLNTTGAGFNDSWSFSGNSWFPFLTNSSYAPPEGAYNAMPVNSSAYAPVLIGGYCSCIGQTYSLDIPPTFEVSAVSPNPADVGANVTVTIHGAAGAGSGPWIDLEADYGNSQGGSTTIYGVNVTTPWNYSQTQLSYPAVGTYEMEFTVEDFFYVNATVFYNLSVVAGPQVTVYADPTTAEAGHEVSFNATVSQGVSPYTYSWNFGDAGTSSAVAPTHTYASPGTYVASLLIHDSGGGNVTGNVTVDVIAAVVAHASSNVTTTDAGLPVSFTGSGSSGSGTYGSYHWSFGDGGTASTASATHTFAAAGTYHVQINVTDSLGFVGTASLTVFVNAALAGATITAIPSSPASGETVSFGAGASDGTPPLSYAWNFGDGGTSSSGGPTHAYGSAGTYTVTLVITDALGQRVTAHDTITVTSSSSGFSLTSGTGLSVLIGIIFAILVIIAAVVLMRRGRGSAPAPGSPQQGSPGPTVPPPGSNP